MTITRIEPAPPAWATQQSGRSLRDEFAMHAMQGMLAHSTRYRVRSGRPATMSWHAALTEEAYEIADAMMTARQRR